MDQYKVSPYEEACHFSSPPLSMKEFRDQCIEVAASEIYPSNSNRDEDGESRVKQEGDKQAIEVEEISKTLGVDHETASDLRDVCNIENLKCEYDEKFDYLKPKVFQEYPDDNSLQIVRMIKEGRTKTEQASYFITFPEAPEMEQGDESQLIAHDEVILNARLFHPEKTKILHQFFLVGNNTLAELRDVIVCRTDKIIFGEFSNNPDLTGTKEAKELHPSSFFFIEDCFYNDTRSPIARDYSKVIRGWAKGTERFTVPGLGILKSKTMQDTKFSDLSLRMGFPYLFCHQGNCEHILVFTDMRLKVETDPKFYSSYPYKATENIIRRRKCSICFIHLAKWKTLNDALTFEDPGFFCDKCFRYLHYTKDGKKLCSFQAYPHIEDD